ADLDEPGTQIERGSDHLAMLVEAGRDADRIGKVTGPEAHREDGVGGLPGNTDQTERERTQGETVCRLRRQQARETDGDLAGIECWHGQARGGSGDGSGRRGKATAGTYSNPRREASWRWARRGPRFTYRRRLGRGRVPTGRAACIRLTEEP